MLDLIIDLGEQPKRGPQAFQEMIPATLTGMPYTCGAVRAHTFNSSVWM